MWPLLCLGMFPLFLFCWEFLIINGYRILLNAFSAPTDMIMWFLFFILFMWWITFIDMQMYQPCIPRINSTWSWCIQLANFFEDFFEEYFILVKWVWGLPSSSILWNSLRRGVSFCLLFDKIHLWSLQGQGFCW